LGKPHPDKLLLLDSSYGLRTANYTLPGRLQPKNGSATALRALRRSRQTGTVIPTAATGRFVPATLVIFRSHNV
jgi:hypothetical protein